MVGSGTPLMRTTHVRNIEASVFKRLLVYIQQVVVHTCAVEHYEAAFQSSVLLYAGEKC